MGIADNKEVMVDIARLFKDDHELLAGFRMLLPEQSQAYFHELEDRTEISFYGSIASVPQTRNLNEHEQAEGELAPKTAPTQRPRSSMTLPVAQSEFHLHAFRHSARCNCSRRNNRSSLPPLFSTPI
ncbi:hypothetical protein L210DRAFT_2731164 [Boletus edulis BED1]|uniref:Uncharacterized protein n=1 Tax=Boletus edulis BED1 TaxID=1328754 RepID=A0AAD4G4Y7_BOLED|nr:hypothetical protein L210DRAFT_2731164 [Boletus edulis BED1]